MKKIFALTILILIFFCPIFGQKLTNNKAELIAYTNDIYKFSVNVPANWKLYGELKNDTVNNKCIVDWGLPLIYSELEKTEIENSISITAYKRNDILSLEKLINFEYLRIDTRMTDMKPDTANDNAYIIYHTFKGKEYKGKSYFVFKNEIGYIINFMATPGTFDKNLKTFEDFYKSINFI